MRLLLVPFRRLGRKSPWLNPSFFAVPEQQAAQPFHHYQRDKRSTDQRVLSPLDFWFAYRLKTLRDHSLEAILTLRDRCGLLGIHRPNDY